MNFGIDFYEGGGCHFPWDEIDINYYCIPSQYPSQFPPKVTLEGLAILLSFCPTSHPTSSPTELLTDITDIPNIAVQHTSLTEPTCQSQQTPDFDMAEFTTTVAIDMKNTTGFTNENLGDIITNITTYVIRNVLQIMHNMEICFLFPSQFKN